MVQGKGFEMYQLRGANFFEAVFPHLVLLWMSTVFSKIKQLA